MYFSKKYLFLIVSFLFFSLSCSGLLDYSNQLENNNALFRINKSVYEFYTQNNSSFSTTFTSVAGKEPITWSIVRNSQSIPPKWISINESTGLLSGDVVDETYGSSYSFTIQAKDSSSEIQTDSLNVFIYVSSGVPLEIETSALMNAEQGNAYSMKLLSQGGTGNKTWIFADSNHPSWMAIQKINNESFLVGTPQDTLENTSYTFALKVFDEDQPASNSVQKTFTLQLGSIQINGNTSFEVYEQQELEKNFISTGGIKLDNQAWTLLPSEPQELNSNFFLSIQKNDSGEGVLFSSDNQGNPTFVGESTSTDITYQNIIISVKDNSVIPSLKGVKKISVKVLNQPSGFTITSSSIPSAVIGSSYQNQLTYAQNNGEVVWAFDIGSDTPAWLELSNTGELISNTSIANGKVNGSYGQNVYLLKIKATDQDGSVSKTFTLNIAKSNWEISENSFELVKDIAWQDNITLTGSPFETVTYSWASGYTPPAWLTLSSNTLSGTPTTAETIQIQVQAEDSALMGGSNVSPTSPGQIRTKTIELVINNTSGPKGSKTNPYIVDNTDAKTVSGYIETQNTGDIVSDIIDTYYGHSQLEYGPEHFYKLIIPSGEEYNVTATLSEATADVDIHLISSLNIINAQAQDVLERNDISLSYSNLTEGTYYLVVDGYGDPGVTASYKLTVKLETVTTGGSGSQSSPISISNADALAGYNNSDNTSSNNVSDVIDSYSGYSQNESGPEHFYELTVSQPSSLNANLSNLSADLDIHLLSSISITDKVAENVITRHDNTIEASLSAGTYYILIDGYNGVAGSYDLHVQLTAVETINNSTTIVTTPFLVTSNTSTDANSQDLIDTYEPFDSTPEYGPEVGYSITLENGVTLTASLTDEGAVDTDVYIMTSNSPVDTVARNDVIAHYTNNTGSSITAYIVVDSYGTDDSNAGDYELRVGLSTDSSGTIGNPIAIDYSICDSGTWYSGTGGTSSTPYLETSFSPDIPESIFDSYIGYSQDESGPEYIFKLVTTTTKNLAVSVISQDTADIDAHIIGRSTGTEDLGRDKVLSRADVNAGYNNAPAGIYYIIADTYINNVGEFYLAVSCNTP